MSLCLKLFHDDGIKITEKHKGYTLIELPDNSNINFSSSCSFVTVNGATYDMPSVVHVLQNGIVVSEYKSVIKNKIQQNNILLG